MSIENIRNALEEAGDFVDAMKLRPFSAYSPGRCQYLSRRLRRAIALLDAPQKGEAASLATGQRQEFPAPTGALKRYTVRYYGALWDESEDRNATLSPGTVMVVASDVDARDAARGAALSPEEVLTLKGFLMDLSAHVKGRCAYNYEEGIAAMWKRLDGAPANDLLALLKHRKPTDERGAALTAVEREAARCVIEAFDRYRGDVSTLDRLERAIERLRLSIPALPGSPEGEA